MLQQLLHEIKQGGTLETSVLAARLGTSPQLVAAMLDHLQRLNLIGSYSDCSTGCGGCALAESCSVRPSIRLWQSRNK
jgi:hypothetical protein